jgi:thioredoxin 1
MGRLAILVPLIAILVLGATGQAGAGNPQAPLSTPELKQIIGSGKKSTVVFFQNPQGGPCRAQNEVLQKLHKDRKGNFNIANVSTLKPEDQKAFYEYGIRNLPQLVLVDGRGKIANFFPPGIQSYAALTAALDRVK